MSASYFDVDGTLIRTNLVHPTLFYLLRQQNPLRSFAKVARALVRGPAMALAELRDRRMFNEALFASYEGISQDRLLLLADQAFDKVIRPALYPEAKSLVARCREQGQDVVLVSGMLDFLAERLAEVLGASSIICNRLEMKNGYATGRLTGPVVAGPEKARLITQHARAHGHDLAECFAFSDSYSDLAMLSVVGHPTVVNPDRQLARLATVYGWPSLSLESAR